MIRRTLGAFLFLELLSISITGQQFEHNEHSLTKFLHDEDGPVGNPSNIEGTRWALLVAGSRGYENYRHQADVCHAYQILKNGGLKDENIIVFMYDDIAYDKRNPRPGVIINSPNGGDVYKGVPKDYTGKNANIHNLFAVLLGNKSDTTGGSGKVLDTGPKDRIFAYYTDHGSPGQVGMPSDETLFADDLIEVLKNKHERNAYASMVFYLEACESGSMFDGRLPATLNIYATTASDKKHPSYLAYCPGEYLFIPPEYDVCLGDTYSVSWMEDSEKHDLRSETLGQQLNVVRRRTAIDNFQGGSKVMQYGNSELSKEFLYSYLGTDKVNDNYTSSKQGVAPSTRKPAAPSTRKPISQRDADLLHYRLKFNKAPKDSKRRFEAQKQLLEEINSRTLVDNKVMQISELLYGAERGKSMLHSVRPEGQPLVDDWSCLKTLVKTYEEYCGPLSRYGMKYTRAFANMCNAGITVNQMMMASARICS